LAKTKGKNARPQFEKHSLKPLRSIEIYPEPGTANEAVPCCYEYQVEMGTTRAFLRTTTRYSAIPVRVLAAPGKTPNSSGPLCSVDDLVWNKQAIRRCNEEIDERYRSPSFFRRNLWWLLSLFLLLFGDFLHVAERGVLAAWLTPPYAATGGLLLALWAWRRWPKSWRQKPDDLSAKIEALGESIPFEDNLPGTNFGRPDAGAAQRLALDFAEGRVSQVRYTYFNLPSDEGDLSTVVLSFTLIQTDGTALFCQHGVSKSDALFFLCENEFVRLLGRVEAGKMAVEHAVNLDDGHVFSGLSLFALLRKESPVAKYLHRFFLWMMGDMALFAGAAVVAVLGLGFLTFWCMGLLMGFNQALWEVFEQAGYISAVILLFALTYGAWRGARKAGCALRIARALGLGRPAELAWRQRGVCNQSYCRW